MGQSAEFGEFLKLMRARLVPEAADTGRQRRVPGLRREEVAQRAGVSTDYYTRLEQGRQMSPSSSVLNALARALELGPAEQSHLLDLLHQCAPQGKVQPVSQRVRPAVRQLLEAVGNAPAMILGRRTDVLAANRMARLLFADFSALPPGERNLCRWLLLAPEAAELFPDWKSTACEAVAALRVDVGRHPNDPESNHLVGELAVNSEHFRQWWAGHKVHSRQSGTVRLNHPTVGSLELDFETMVLPEDADQLIRIYTAKSGSPSQDALTLLTSWETSPWESGAGTGMGTDPAPGGTPTSGGTPASGDAADITKRRNS